MSILARPAHLVNANVATPAPQLAARPHDCPEYDEIECRSCGGSGWEIIDPQITAIRVANGIATGQPITLAELNVARAEYGLPPVAEPAKQVVDRETWSTVHRAYGLPQARFLTYREPTAEDRRWAAEVFGQGDPGHAIDEVSPETDGITAEYLGLLACEAHREAEDRFLDWHESR